jgi:glycosyltransferase involved in cell wall biosynthesis
MDSLTELYENNILQWGCQRAARIIASSAYVQHSALQSFQAKTRLVTPGVDIKQFTPNKKRSRNEVLFVGNLRKTERYKGLNYLIEAMVEVQNKIPAAQLIVVGEGNDRVRHETHARELGVNATFCGALREKPLVARYQRAAIFAMPSLTESCPLVILEAMACATPVVATDSTGIPYIVKENKTGLLFPPANPAAIAKKTIQLLRSPKLAQKFGNAGRKVVEGLSWEEQARKTHSVLVEVLR